MDTAEKLRLRIASMNTAEKENLLRLIDREMLKSYKRSQHEKQARRRLFGKAFP